MLIIWNWKLKKEINKNYYLKHDIVDDEIINSYVCFVYNNAEHCMKGADNGTSFAANTQIIRDFQTFNNLPDNSNPGCYYNSSSSYCFGGGFYDESTGSNQTVLRTFLALHLRTVVSLIVAIRFVLNNRPLSLTPIMISRIW